MGGGVNFFFERHLIFDPELFTWGEDTMGQVGSGAQMVGRSQLSGRHYRRLNFKKSEFSSFFSVFWSFWNLHFSSQSVIHKKIIFVIFFSPDVLKNFLRLQETLKHYQKHFGAIWSKAKNFVFLRKKVKMLLLWKVVSLSVT